MERIGLPYPGASQRESGDFQLYTGKQVEKELFLN